MKSEMDHILDTRAVFAEVQKQAKHFRSEQRAHDAASKECSRAAHDLEEKLRALRSDLCHWALAYGDAGCGCPACLYYAKRAT